MEEIVPRLYAALAAALVLTLAACGDEASHDRIRDDAQQMQEQVPDERIADATDVDHVITVVLNEWAVELDRDTIAPGSVRLRVRNNGEHEHALAVQGGSVNQRTETIPPGQWAVLDLDLQPGTYDVVCPLDAPVGQDHAGRGMTAVLTVSDAAPTDGPTDPPPPAPAPPQEQPR
jgi:hypothetical protein